MTGKIIIHENGIVYKNVIRNTIFEFGIIDSIESFKINIFKNISNKNISGYKLLNGYNTCIRFYLKDFSELEKIETILSQDNENIEKIIHTEDEFQEVWEYYGISKDKWEEKKYDIIKLDIIVKFPNSPFGKEFYKNNNSQKNNAEKNESKEEINVPIKEKEIKINKKIKMYVEPKTSIYYELLKKDTILIILEKNHLMKLFGVKLNYQMIKLGGVYLIKKKKRHITGRYVLPSVATPAVLRHATLRVAL